MFHFQCAIGAFLVNEVINGNFDVGGVIRKYSERTGQRLFDPTHEMRRKGGGAAIFPAGKGNFGTPERYSQFYDMNGGKGSGGRFDGPMNPQGQWNSPYENPGRNWKSPLPAPPGYGSYGGDRTVAGMMNSKYENRGDQNRILVLICVGVAAVESNAQLIDLGWSFSVLW